MNATGESDLRNYYDYVDTLRESKLRPALEKLLPVLCMSALGTMPDDLNLTFPPLWTPTAKETADIAKAKAEAVVSVFQSGLVRADTAAKELRKLSEDTGLFGNISDEEIGALAGKTYQDVTALRDPLAGLDFGGDGAVFAQDALALDYDPNQLRDKNGKWTSGGGNGKIKGTKYAPSPQRNHEGIQLNPKKYARLCGTLGTRFPNLKPEDGARIIRDASYEYRVTADGYGGMIVHSRKRL